MKRVLLVGLRPETVDFGDPALPPGLSAEKIHAGIALTLRDMTDRGWQAASCLIDPDPAVAERQIGQALATARYDCIVIGAGVRLPPKGLLLFESVIDAVHRGAPGAAIAFNTRPEDSADAAARGLRRRDG